MELRQQNGLLYQLFIFYCIASYIYPSLDTKLWLLWETDQQKTKGWYLARLYGVLYTVWSGALTLSSTRVIQLAIHSCTFNRCSELPLNSCKNISLCFYRGLLISGVHVRRTYIHKVTKWCPPGPTVLVVSRVIARNPSPMLCACV